MSNYRIDDEALVNAFKALANPNRLVIFRRLLSCCEQGEACAVDECITMAVGELGKEVDIAASTLSHHLKELNRAGIIGMKRNGKQVLCWLETAMVDQLVGFLQTEK